MDVVCKKWASVEPPRRRYGRYKVYSREGCSVRLKRNGQNGVNRGRAGGGFIFKCNHGEEGGFYKDV